MVNFVIISQKKGKKKENTYLNVAKIKLKKTILKEVFKAPGVNPTKLLFLRKFFFAAAKKFYISL